MDYGERQACLSEIRLACSVVSDSMRKMKVDMNMAFDRIQFALQEILEAYRASLEGESDGRNDEELVVNDEIPNATDTKVQASILCHQQLHSSLILSKYPSFENFDESKLQATKLTKSSEENDWASDGIGNFMTTVHKQKQEVTLEFPLEVFIGFRPGGLPMYRESYNNSRAFHLFGKLPKTNIPIETFLGLAYLVSSTKIGEIEVYGVELVESYPKQLSDMVLDGLNENLVAALNDRLKDCWSRIDHFEVFIDYRPRDFVVLKNIYANNSLPKVFDKIFELENALIGIFAYEFIKYCLVPEGGVVLLCKALLTPFDPGGIKGTVLLLKEVLKDGDPLLPYWFWEMFATIFAMPLAFGFTAPSFVKTILTKGNPKLFLMMNNLLERISHVANFKGFLLAITLEGQDHMVAAIVKDQIASLASHLRQELDIMSSTSVFSKEQIQEILSHIQEEMEVVQVVANTTSFWVRFLVLMCQHRKFLKSWLLQVQLVTNFMGCKPSRCNKAGGISKVVKFLSILWGLIFLIQNKQGQVVVLALHVWLCLFQEYMADVPSWSMFLPLQALGVQLVLMPARGLKRRQLPHQREKLKYWLVKWKSLPSAETTWEGKQAIKSNYPTFNLEDKVGLKGNAMLHAQLGQIYSYGIECVWANRCINNYGIRPI